MLLFAKKKRFGHEHVPDETKARVCFYPLPAAAAAAGISTTHTHTSSIIHLYSK